ncbi:MAG: hypothetical protein LWY06_06755 [Firmicutes bacterium]|nr:hypothetical protein [Bacillota bacterium]
MMKSKKGYILILTFLVMAMMFFFGLMLVEFMSSETKLTIKSEHDNIAAEAANAGIDDAIYYLKQNASWASGFNNTALGHSNSTYSMTFDKNQTVLPYSTNNSTGTATITGYGGRTVPAGSVHLVSIGKFGRSKIIEESMITPGGTLFSAAIQANTNITFSGNGLTDSFNSDNGTYQQTSQQSGGNIATNSNTNAIVRLTGNVDVNGTVTVGTGGTQAASVSSSGGSSYQGFSTSSPVSLPFLTPPSGTNQGSVSVSGHGSVTINPGTYTNLSGSGQSVINLTAGDYVFTGNISLSGNSTIVLPATGKVKIYVLGNIDITGNSINNTSEKPTNLVIYGGPNTTSVKISGNGQGYFGLYAPAADVKITGNGAIYGGIVGDTIDITGNAAIHYDQALQKITGGSGMVTVLSRWGGI